MLKTTLAGLRAHLLRLILTAFAITLGVGFVSGTFVLTDTMKSGFDQQFTASADKVSVAVLPRHDAPSGSRIPASLPDRLKRLPGVADAQGEVRGDAPLVGKDGKAYGDFPTLGLSIATGALQRYRLASGHLPTGADMVVLDEKTARRSGFRVGDTAMVLDRAGRPHAFRVSGLMDFGVDQEIGFRGAAGFSAPTATWITGRPGFVEVDVKGAPGAEQASLRAAVAAAVGGSYDVVTSHELAKRLSSSSGVSPEQLGLFLLAFAVVSLFVSALVIYNTFSILIAQRLREMALLRCVGATRAQVFRGVLLESLIVGFVASALGVVLGVGLGTGGAAIFASADNASPGPVTVTPTPVMAGLLAGTLVTLVAALLPARAATRVPPVAALRRQTEGPVRGRAGAVRLVIGGLAATGGLALTGLGLASPAGPGAFLIVMAGGTALFFGVVALSPQIVRRLSTLVGWLPSRLFGVPGRLARENAARNPKRTAITTIALTVGVTLMTMFSVALTSTEATADAKLTAQFPVDYRLATQVGADQLIPRQVAAALRAKPQVAAVIEEREATGRVSGHKLSIGTMTDHSLGRSIKPDVVAGSIVDLRPGSVALQKARAKDLGVGVGGTVTLGAGARAFPLRVAGIFTDNALIPSIAVTEADFTRAFGPKDDTQIAVIAKKGVPADESRNAVEAATRGYPMVKVSSLADIKGQFTKAVDQLFVLVGALLGLAIIISLIGIANTLTLSVVERTRESALLRALGLTRRSLRWMLSLEAVIMAVIGALLGVVLGTAFGWAALLSSINGAVLGFPALRVAAFILIAGLAGLLAAVIPSRRAAKTSIVESLAAD